MSLLSFCQWLNETSWSVTLRESTWAYPILGAIHLLGIGLFGGMLAMGNFRLLGIWMPAELVSEIFDRFRPWKLAGLAAVLITGVLLTLSEPVKCYTSVSFWISIAVLLLAGLNAWVFRFGVYRSVGAWDTALVTPIQARVAACFSLFLWASLVFAGRGIAFF